MKALLIAALFVTVAVVATASDNMHVHLHLDKPITDRRFGGFVNKFINSVVYKKNIEVHIHVPIGDDEIEFGFFDDIGNAFKDVGEKIGGGVVDIGKKIGDGVVDIGKKIGDGVVDAGKEVAHQAEKGFDITRDGIETAISKTEDAFNKVKDEIRSIQLPHIDISGLVEPIIEIVHIVENMVQCAIVLKDAIPHLISFAKSAANNDAEGAVLNLMRVLHYMPEISQRCINKLFSIPPETMNKIQCAADITGLSADVVLLVSDAENTINAVKGLEVLIPLISQTVSDCTGAFN